MEELKALLIKMSYNKENGFYSQPERKVFFVGNYIDHGPKIRETLQIVRAMVENNPALNILSIFR